ncbi:MAG: SH3 domain-containing protein [Bdellovibrionales bacterium]|nr:SH3 domain-containing protein [Bdellovibrionales bacterium]
MDKLQCRYGIFILSLALCWTAAADLAATQDSASAIYQAGVQSYQKGELAKAQGFFLQALDKAPDNKFILYNLGLADFQLESRGRAVGAWRRALYVDPDFSLARRALEFATKQMGPLQSMTISGWESFRADFLTRISLNRALAFNALFLLLGGILLIRYSAKRREAVRAELPSPPLPYVGMFCGLAFMLFVGLSVAKAYDSFTPRATVIAKNLEVRSGPSPDDASLFELPEGHEVIIKQVVNDWVQVTSPGGLTGWVQLNLLFHSSGRKPW